MSTRDTVIRSMHDVGLAAWFGGALMGAVGLNGATNEVDDPTDRAKVASAGWARWAPVNAAAIGAHLIGGIGLVLTNRQRLAVQSGARTNTIVKTALTGVAIASTAFSGWRGTQVFAAGKVHADGGTTPGDGGGDPMGGRTASGYVGPLRESFTHPGLESTSEHP